MRLTDHFRRRAIALSLIAMVLVFILWNVPQLAILSYPFRLFVTYVHEAGHSLMTLLTGGQVVGFTVSANGAGLALRVGGESALIIPAGYLGAAFFGAALFYFIHSVRYTRFISWVLGLGVIAFTLLFARPDQSGVPLALIVGLLSGLILLLLAWKAPRDINLLVLSILAMMTALHAVLDLWGLIQYASVTSGPVRNDAIAFSHAVICHSSHPKSSLWSGRYWPC